jgi:hypothetical protein
MLLAAPHASIVATSRRIAAIGYSAAIGGTAGIGRRVALPQTVANDRGGLSRLSF